MQLFAALIYWVIVALWLFVLAIIARAYWRNPRTFGAVRLLLSVVAVDTARNVVENTYFGLYFGAQYGLFPGSMVGVLGQPHLLVIPKVINVGASLLVLSILLLRWLPQAARERDAAEGALSEAEQRFGLLVGGVHEYAICLLDPEGKVTSWNSGATRIKGYVADEIIGVHFARFYTPEDQAKGVPAQALATALREGRFEARAIRVRKDGAQFWANVVIEPIRSADGGLLGFAKVTKDITKERTAEQKLEHLALFDQLTDLPNRFHLLSDLQKQFASDGGRQEIALALFDVDRFKDLNDTLGHEVGDGILRAIAERLRAACKGQGQAYCTGGDSFAVVLGGDAVAATALVQSLMPTLEQPLESVGRRLFVGVSAGLAFAPAHASSGDELVASADLALHEAKQGGGRRYHVFTAAIRAQVAARQQIDAELRRAFGEREFVLCYQPQIRLSDGKLVGAEALLRWQHPTRGLLSPAAFIDTLSASPIAVSVGNWILATACAQASAWRVTGLGAIRIGVNLFPSQFHDPGVVDVVKSALLETALPPGLLELEITENIALGRDEATLTTLNALRALDVGLAFDDFGTGYASLSYLTRYPLTRIKIDRSFVSKIAENSPTIDTAIVRSIITMGHNLGLEVIAEGVETDAQAAYLRSRKCEEAQGYLFGKPVLVEQFTALLQSGRKPDNMSDYAAA